MARDCNGRIDSRVTLDDYQRACDAVMTSFFNAAEDEVGGAGTAQIDRS
jgi:hypothetical protein